MGRQTKLTASQHEEIRAVRTERERLLQHIEDLERQIARTRLQADRLTKKRLAIRYNVNPHTIERVLSGEPYGSVKPEPATSHSGGIAS